MGRLWGMIFFSPLSWCLSVGICLFVYLLPMYQSDRHIVTKFICKRLYGNISSLRLRKIVKNWLNAVWRYDQRFRPDRKIHPLSEGRSWVISLTPSSSLQWVVTHWTLSLPKGWTDPSIECKLHAIIWIPRMKFLFVAIFKCYPRENSCLLWFSRYSWKIAIVLSRIRWYWFDYYSFTILHSVSCHIFPIFISLRWSPKTVLFIWLDPHIRVFNIVVTDDPTNKQTARQRRFHYRSTKSNINNNNKRRRPALPCWRRGLST